MDKGSGSGIFPDPDPGDQKRPDPTGSGSGSATHGLKAHGKKKDIEWLQSLPCDNDCVGLSNYYVASKRKFSNLLFWPYM